MKKKHIRTMNQQIRYTVLIVIVAVSATISLINYFVIQKNARNTALENCDEQNRLTGNHMEVVISNLESVMNRIVYSQGVQYAMSSYDQREQNTDRYVLQERVREALTDAAVVSELLTGVLANIIVFDREGNYITSIWDYNEASNIGETHWKELADQRQGKSMWLPYDRDENDLRLKNKHIVSVVKKIYSTKQYSSNNTYGSGIGYILFHIREDDFSAYYQDMSYGESGVFYAVDEEGTILSSTDKSRVGTALQEDYIHRQNQAVYKTIEGTEYALLSAPIGTTGWYLIQHIQEEELIAGTKKQNSYLLIVTILVVVITGSLMAYLSKKMTRSLTNFQAEMKKVEQGDLSISMSDTGMILEVQELFHSFHVMVKQLKHMMNQIYESAKREQQMQLYVTEARLSILQSQMNPHFLYNTLDSIGWMATLGNHGGISQMVYSLGEILRASINMDTFISNVRFEIDLLNKYLYIQRVRYQERLHACLQVQEEAMDCEILKFMLQPFVENAMIHGMRENGRVLNITITIEKQGDYLKTAIQDDGRGMEEAVRETFFQEKQYHQGKTTGKGCYNVAQRLQLVYGNRSNCQVESRLGEGTLVTIQIPRREYREGIKYTPEEKSGMFDKKTE